ncbi:MAG: hypothetical protein D6785_05095 [Planctomycetota bacterium]|nr:MAG: hypothetical protein D6785_05095 [Planctomycetota bacterium]
MKSSSFNVFLSSKSPNLSRPRVLYNLAMSLDGKIGASEGILQLSSPEDLKEVHAIRSSVDGIMVGIDTIIWDNPSLTVRYVPHSRPSPYPIIVDSHCRLPLDAKVLREHSNIIIGTLAKPPIPKKRELEAMGCHFFTYPANQKGLVPLKSFLEDLKKEGIHTILLEGGGKLGYSMLFEGLVDELRVAISPYVLGSQGGTSFAEGPMVAALSQGIHLQLLSAKNLGNNHILHYRVLLS